jgi:hypothetical protein
MFFKEKPRFPNYQSSTLQDGHWERTELEYTCSVESNLIYVDMK